MDSGPRKITIPIEVFIKRSWPFLAFVAVLALGASGAFLWVAISGVGRKTAPVAIASPQSSAATSSQILAPRSIDGVLVPAAETNLLPFAVIIDNHADARPSVGLAKANLVFEFPVEGGMTRYLAIFDATTTVDQIGPVRSVRPYTIEIAHALNAVTAHVGGSPEALAQIALLAQFRDLNEFSNGKYYWRSGRRLPPHNIYTRTDLLHTAAQAKRWISKPLRGWKFTDEDPRDSATGTSRGHTHGPHVPVGGIIDARWTYHRDANAYERLLNGSPHVELDGNRVTAKNVLVLLTDAKIVDTEGRLKLRTTEKGRARLYRNGRVSDLVWRRPTGSFFEFETVDGSDALFVRGTTWVEIVTSKDLFDNLNG